MLSCPLLALLLAPTHLLLAPSLLLAILALLLLLPLLLLLLLEVGLSSTARCCSGSRLLSVTSLEAGSGLVGRHGPLLLGHAIPTHASTSPLALLELALLWVTTSIVLLLLLLLLSHVPVHALKKGCVKKAESRLRPERVIFQLLPAGTVEHPSCLPGHAQQPHAGVDELVPLQGCCSSDASTSTR